MNDVPIIILCEGIVCVLDHNMLFEHLWNFMEEVADKGFVFGSCQRTIIMQPNIQNIPTNPTKC